MQAKDVTNHVKENGNMYFVILLLGGGGGVAAITDNLPVPRSEFEVHLKAYKTHSVELNGIKDVVGGIRLEQLRQALRIAYADRCAATDQQAIRYIDGEIERLQRQYEALNNNRRYNPPPCKGT